MSSDPESSEKRLGKLDAHTLCCINERISMTITFATQKQLWADGTHWLLPVDMCGVDIATEGLRHAQIWQPAAGLIVHVEGELLG